MKIILTLVTVLFLAVACSRNVSKTDEAIGSTTITWIEDKPGPSLQPLKLYPTVPDSLWKALGLQEGVPSSMSCFLLQTEGKNILLDAGLGAPFSQLLPQLKEMGIGQKDIHFIYITHMHPDHIGGMLQDGKAVFPHAEVYVNSKEAAAWQSMPGEKGRLPKKVMETYKERWHLFEAGDTLIGGVLTIAAYGHTPGHTLFQKDSLLVIADLLHGAALQLEHPEYNPVYDMDVEAAKQSRIRILQYAKENRLTLFGMHLPAPGIIYPNQLP